MEFVTVSKFDNNNYSDFTLGLNVSAYFYIPEFDEPPSTISGMVISLFGEHPEPTSVFSYFSKEEDIGKIHDLLKTTIDWGKCNTFAVGDWHIPGLLQLCEEYGKIIYYTDNKGYTHKVYYYKVQINGSNNELPKVCHLDNESFALYHVFTEYSSISSQL